MIVMRAVLGLILLLVFCQLSLFGCGSAQAGAPTPLNVPDSSGVGPVFRELASTVRQTIGAKGGALEAVLSDGTTFRLEVPAGALNRNVDFGLTPVEVTGTLGLPVQLPVAAKIEPSGVKFVGGATFSVTLPAFRDAATFLPYIMEDSGSPMRLTAGTRQGQTTRFVLDHLTVPGLSNSPPPNPPYVPQATSVEQLAALVALNSSDPSARDALLRQFAQRLVTQGQPLFNTNVESSCQDWLEEFTPFRRLLQFTSPEVESELRQLVDPVAAQVIRRGIDLVELLASRSDQWEDLKPINDFYLVHAQRNDLDTQAYQLDAGSVKRNLLFEFVVDQFSSNPQVLDENEAAQLQFRVGYRLSPSNPVHYESENVTAQIELTGGETPDLTVKTVTPNINLIYNQVSLTPNSSEIQGRLTAFFTGLPIFSETIDSEFHPFTFRVPGKVKISATANEGAQGARTVTAAVRQGRAPLVGGQVRFTVVSGTGNIAPGATTDEQGLATESLVGENGGFQEVQVMVSAGGQQATASTIFSSVFDGLYLFQGKVDRVEDAGAEYLTNGVDCQGYFEVQNSTVVTAPAGTSVGQPFAFPENYTSAGGFAMPNLTNPSVATWLMQVVSGGDGDAIQSSISSGVLTWDRFTPYRTFSDPVAHGFFHTTFSIPLRTTGEVQVSYDYLNRFELTPDRHIAWGATGRLTKLR